MVDIEEIIKTPEYNWLNDYKDRLCLLVVSGSHGYGLNIEGSDIDIRGVLLPTKEEILGLQNFEQKIDEDTDTTLYEFSKFIRLIMNSNPNTIEILGCKEILIFNEIGLQLVDNIKMFLSKKCLYSFGGYATAQLRRVECALAKYNYTDEERFKHMKATMEVAMQKLEDKNEIFKNQNVSIETDKDNLYLNINITHQPINLVRVTLNDLLTIEKTYNKLGQRNNKRDEKALNKHLSHLFRLYFTCFDILEKGVVETYREQDKDFLLDIKLGKFIEDGHLTDDFYPILKEFEERLEKDKLLNIIPEKPNYEIINNFVMEVNEKIIKNKIKQFKQPIKFVKL